MIRIAIPKVIPNAHQGQMGRRSSYRIPGVGPQTDEAEAGRDAGSRPAARTCRYPIQIVGVGRLVVDVLQGDQLPPFKVGCGDHGNALFGFVEGALDLLGWIS